MKWKPGGVYFVHGRKAAVFECLGGKEKRVGYNQLYGEDTNLQLTERLAIFLRSMNERNSIAQSY